MQPGAIARLTLPDVHKDILETLRQARPARPHTRARTPLGARRWVCDAAAAECAGQRGGWGIGLARLRLTGGRDMVLVRLAWGKGMWLSRPSRMPASIQFEYASDLSVLRSRGARAKGGPGPPRVDTRRVARAPPCSPARPPAGPHSAGRPAAAAAAAAAATLPAAAAAERGGVLHALPRHGLRPPLRALSLTGPPAAPFPPPPTVPPGRLGRPVSQGAPR